MIKRQLCRGLCTLLTTKDRLSSLIIQRVRMGASSTWVQRLLLRQSRFQREIEMLRKRAGEIQQVPKGCHQGRDSVINTIKGKMVFYSSRGGGLRWGRSMEVSAFANRARSVHNCNLMLGIFPYIRKAFLLLLHGLSLASPCLVLKGIVNCRGEGVIWQMVSSSWKSLLSEMLASPFRGLLIHL